MISYLVDYNVSVTLQLDIWFLSQTHFVFRMGISSNAYNKWKMFLLYSHIIIKLIHLNFFVTMEVWPLSSLYVWSRIKFISSWIIKCNKQEGDMNAMCNLWQIERDADIAKIAFIIRLVKLTPSQFTVCDVMKLYSRQDTALYHVLYWTMYCLRILE